MVKQFGPCNGCCCYVLLLCAPLKTSLCNAGESRMLNGALEGSPSEQFRGSGSRQEVAHRADTLGGRAQECKAGVRPGPLKSRTVQEELTVISL